MLSAKILASTVDNEIDEHSAVLKTLSQSQALARGDLANFWEEAHRAMDVVPGSWLSVNSAQGQLLLSTLVPFGSPLPQRSDPTEISRLISTRSGTVSDLRQSIVTGQLTAYSDFPIFDGNAPKYILRSACRPRNFTTSSKIASHTVNL